MSRELIESIISNNMLEANDMVEAKLAEIRERKIYEMKRIFAAEAFGRRPTPDEQRAAGRKRASDVYPDPRDAAMPGSDSTTKNNSGTKPKKPRKASPGKKPEAPKPQEKVERSWSQSAKLGLKRAKTRLNIYKNVPGELARLTKDLAVKKAKDIVSDPSAAAASAAKATTKGVTKGVVKTATHVGKKLASAPVTQDIKDIGFRNL
jgi:hypothetical protein